MKELNIYLADGSFGGNVVMESPTSKITAVRVKRQEIQNLDNELNQRGVYLLLIGSDSVYVGQTAGSIKNRITNTHTGDIDVSWHTAVGFTCPTAGSDELYFLENALCEYAHENFQRCLTTSPARANCNATYRNSNYRLGSGQIRACNSYFEDIKFYLETFKHLGGSIFGTIPEEEEKVTPPPVEERNEFKPEEFYFKSLKRDAEGVLIMSNDNPPKFILKAGSRVSNIVSASGKEANISERRKQAEAEGKLKGRILKEDIIFKRSSTAGEFLYGTAFDGPKYWKDKNGITLGEVLKSQKDS